MGDEALAARLRVLFLDELDEHVGRLESGLGTLGRRSSEMPVELIDDLFRSAHSLKGAAASVGETLIAALGHELENHLSSLRQQEVELGPGLLSSMIELVDRVADAAVALRRKTQESGNAKHASPAVLVAADQDGSRVAPMTVGPEAAESSAVRVDGNRLDALLSEAGELITSTYRSELLVTGCLRVSERLTDEAESWRSEKAALQRTLGPVLAEHPELREALDRVDAGWRRSAIGLDRLAQAAAAHQATLRGVATGFAESVKQARMVPFTEATSGLARMVRALGPVQGNQARLIVEAAEVEVDKRLVGTMHDALGHAVRNAVVHGIESPVERSRSGKPAEGTVTVRAVLLSDGILVTVTDDGRGIDLVKVRERAASLGLGANQDGKTDLTEVLFQPGLSTAEEITESSGRGVGLDAVRVAVEAVGGSVSFSSTPGEGAELAIRAPLTLSTIRVLVVRTAGQVVAMPTSAVQRLVRIPAEPNRLGGREVLEHGDVAAPIVALARVLGWAEGAPAHPGSAGLLISVAEGSVALVVDELIGEREVVLRAGSSRLKELNVVLGTTQLGDGSVCLVLSPSVCARASLAATSDDTVVSPPNDSAPPRVLLADDTLTTREFERSILHAAGYDVAVAVDGQQAWEMLQTRDFDAIVSDVNMPRMDGIALCRAIRGSRRHADVPIVLVTSLQSDSDRRRGLDAGADAYLTKQGLDRAELVSTLGRLL